MFLQFKITFLFGYILKCNLFLLWQSWIFTIIAPVFSVTWCHMVFQKVLLLICWFAAQETPMLKTVVLFNIFVETVSFPRNLLSSAYHNMLLAFKNFTTGPHSGYDRGQETYIKELEVIFTSLFSTLDYGHDFCHTNGETLISEV